MNKFNFEFTVVNPLNHDVSSVPIKEQGNNRSNVDLTDLSNYKRKDIKRLSAGRFHI